MGLFDWIKGVAFIEVIEWTEDSPNTIVYRFPTYDRAIKWGAQLTVREGQQAVFVDEGKLADTFGPGRYTLSTKNLPILQGLIGLPFGAETPFKAEVYFVATREFTNLKWGTPNPIIMQSADFGPVRIRSFGTYTLRAREPERLLRGLVGTGGRFTTDSIMDQIRSTIVQQFADTVAEKKFAVMNLAAEYNEIARAVLDRLRSEFEEWGLETPRLILENVTLPEEVEQALDQRSKMGVLGDLDRYQRLKTAEAIGDAAKNPGGAGDAMGLGAGFVLAQQMAKSMGPASTPAGPAKANCPHCAAAVHAAKFCSECGKSLQAENRCKACSEEIPPGTKFCPHCGAKVL